MRGTSPFVLVALVAYSAACARVGNLGSGLGDTLARDARHMTRRAGPAYPGPHVVDAVGLQLDGARFSFALYRPRDVDVAPAVIFLPGRFAPDDQYESYGRLLASHGFVVVIRARYGPDYPDEPLVQDALWLTNWLSAQRYVDARHIGVAGHSMGGRVAITAAVVDARLRSVVAIDPGGHASIPVIGYDVPHLRVPLLLIGAEVAWRGDPICSPRETNYEHYFAHSRPGTLELTLRNADHVQLMDDPDALGQSICRVGSADSTTVRVLSRAATVQFFEETLAGKARAPYVTDAAAESLRVRAGDPPAPVM
jgi:dienelactone hydrolase